MSRQSDSVDRRVSARRRASYYYIIGPYCCLQGGLLLYNQRPLSENLHLNEELLLLRQRPAPKKKNKTRIFYSDVQTTTASDPAFISTVSFISSQQFFRGSGEVWQVSDSHY